AHDDRGTDDRPRLRRRHRLATPSGGVEAADRCRRPDKHARPPVDRAGESLLPRAVLRSKPGRGQAAHTEHPRHISLTRLMHRRARVPHTDILFHDEPTSGIDPQTRINLWRILEDLHAQGKTILLTP